MKMSSPASDSGRDFVGGVAPLDLTSDTRIALQSNGKQIKRQVNRAEGYRSEYDENRSTAKKSSSGQKLHSEGIKEVEQ